VTTDSAGGRHRVQEIRPVVGTDHRYRVSAARRSFRSKVAPWMPTTTDRGEAEEGTAPTAQSRGCDTLASRCHRPDTPLARLPPDVLVFHGEFDPWGTAVVWACRRAGVRASRTSTTRCPLTRLTTGGWGGSGGSPQMDCCASLASAAVVGVASASGRIRGFASTHLESFTIGGASSRAAWQLLLIVPSVGDSAEIQREIAKRRQSGSTCDRTRANERLGSSECGVARGEPRRSPWAIRCGGHVVAVTDRHSDGRPNSPSSRCAATSPMARATVPSNTYSVPSGNSLKRLIQGMPSATWQPVGVSTI
jgi:hypothetical protein